MMSSDNSFVKMYRNILEWGWFRDSYTVHVFFYLILKANYEDKEFLGHEIKRGQLATSLNSIADATGLTIDKVRTAINHLKSTNEITWLSCGKFSIISIVNYDRFQSTSQSKSHANPKQIPNTSQSSPNHFPTTKEYKEYKEIKNTACPDIPEEYRDRFNTYEEYLAWRRR